MFFSFIRLIFSSFFFWAYRSQFSILFFFASIPWYVYSRIKKNIVSKKIPSSYCKNKENKKKYFIHISSLQKNRPLGISGILRVRNGEEFLEASILSYLVMCDEIVIVNNNSYDQTANIAKKIQKLYPKKIRYYEYPFDVYKYGSEEMKYTNADSIFSTAYLYNWSFSLAKYKYVMKVDDDNIVIPHRGSELRNIVLSSPYFAYYFTGLNLMKNNLGDIGVAQGTPYGLHTDRFTSDHVLYPLSEKTFYYYMNTLKREVLYNNLPSLFYGDLFLHLKFFKKNMGLTYSSGDIKNDYMHYISKGIDIDFSKYSEIINKDLILSVFKKYNLEYLLGS